DDLIDFTRDLRDEAVKLASRYKLGPMFTAPVVSKLEGPLATLSLATSGGGTSWPGGSYDPETHILYVSSQSQMTALGLVPPPPGLSDMKYVQGTATSGARLTGGAGASDRNDSAVGAQAPDTGGRGLF